MIPENIVITTLSVVGACFFLTCWLMFRSQKANRSTDGIERNLEEILHEFNERGIDNGKAYGRFILRDMVFFLIRIAGLAAIFYFITNLAVWIADSYKV